MNRSTASRYVTRTTYAKDVLPGDMINISAARTTPVYRRVTRIAANTPVRGSDGNRVLLVTSNRGYTGENFVVLAPLTTIRVRRTRTNLRKVRSIYSGARVEGGRNDQTMTSRILGFKGVGFAPPDACSTR